MSTPDQLTPSNHNLEKYIEENLCGYQLNWLTVQSRALGYSRTRIFEAILSDWLSRRSSREQGSKNEIQTARQAMDEFIFRYQDPVLLSTRSLMATPPRAAIESTRPRPRNLLDRS